MSLPTPRGIFGVHSVTPYSRTDGVPYGFIKVLDSSSISIQADQVDLNGGSNKYPWASEDGAVTSEMSLKVGQMEDFMIELFLGKAPTVTTAETAGNVSTAVNKKGSSVIQATTGIEEIVVIPSTGPANLKFGKYVAKAVSSTTVDIYCSSDIDLTRGTDQDLGTTGKVASAVAVTSGADTDLAAIGLRVTGGSGTIGMTVGDTATFEVRPINAKASVVVVGGAADVFPEFGAIIYAQKRATDEIFEIDAYRCKAGGMPIGFESFNWAKPEVKAKLIYDSARNGVFEMRHVSQ